MDIVQRIKGICDKHDINGAELGHKLGLSKSPMTDWKNGKSKPTLDQIINICELFAISSDYLLTGVESLPKDLTADEAEWLELYRKLEPSKQTEHRLELRGYVKAKEENK